MNLDQVQSLTALLALLALAAAPAVLQWARRRDREDRRDSAARGYLMAGREAAARHLYGEAVGWAWQAMYDYDDSPRLQQDWLREVDRRIGRRA